jgi:hypothetical protein
LERDEAKSNRSLIGLAFAPHVVGASNVVIPPTTTTTTTTATTAMTNVQKKIDIVNDKKSIIIPKFNTPKSVEENDDVVDLSDSDR